MSLFRKRRKRKRKNDAY